MILHAFMKHSDSDLKGLLDLHSFQNIGYEYQNIRCGYTNEPSHHQEGYFIYNQCIVTNTACVYLLRWFLLCTFSVYLLRYLLHVHSVYIFLGGSFVYVWCIFTETAFLGTFSVYLLWQ